MRKPRQLKKNAYYHVSNDEHMKYANEVFNAVKYRAKATLHTMDKQNFRLGRQCVEGQIFQQNHRRFDGLGACFCVHRTKRHSSRAW